MFKPHMQSPETIMLRPHILKRRIPEHRTICYVL